MDLIKKTNIDFVTKRNTFLRASILASVIGMIIIMIPQIPGLGLPKIMEFGIDWMVIGARAPSCFTKQATPASAHWRTMLRIHATSQGRAPGPDSPPTMTQLMPRKSSRRMGPNKGSSDRNLILARVRRR